MWLRVSAFCIALLLASAPAEAKMPKADDLGANSVFGLWEPPDMDAIIAIVMCGEMLCAKLVRHKYETLADTDVNNPDPALRMRPLQGLAIIEGLEAVKRGKWRGGAFYDPRTGKTYSPKLKVLDENRVKISGCIAPGLCKGYVWKRVSAFE